MYIYLCIYIYIHISPLEGAAHEALPGPAGPEAPDY